MIDDDFKVAAFMINYDVIRIGIMNYLVGLNAGHACRIEHALVLGRTQGHQPLHKDLKIKDDINLNR